MFLGKTFNYTLFDGAIRASDLEKIKDSEGNPLRSYDPAYMNTINCVNFIFKIQTSRICFIDGDKGILQYRGIPIEQLAEKSNFLEVAYLLIVGELPTKQQMDKFSFKIKIISTKTKKNFQQSVGIAHISSQLQIYHHLPPPQSQERLKLFHFVSLLNICYDLLDAYL